jgi:hypothetical protein
MPAPSADLYVTGQASWWFSHGSIIEPADSWSKGEETPTGPLKTGVYPPSSPIATCQTATNSPPPVGEALRDRLGKRGNLRTVALGKAIMGHGPKPALEVGALFEQQPDATRIPLRQKVLPPARADVAAENLIELVRRLVMVEDNHECSQQTGKRLELVRGNQGACVFVHPIRMPAPPGSRP